MKKDIMEKLQNIIKNKTGKSLIGTDNMNNLELDSIEFVDLIVQIEDDLNVEFPIENLTMESLGDFNDFATLVGNLLDSNE